MIRRALDPLRPLVYRPSPLRRHTHIRHASLNSAIERGIRKSRTGDGFESRRYGNNGRSEKRRGDYDESASRRYDNNDRFGNRRIDFGSFGARRNDNDHFGNRRWDSKSRKNMEEAPPIAEFDPDEFIRTGILPNQARTQVGPNASKLTEKQKAGRNDKSFAGGRQPKDKPHRIDKSSKELNQPAEQGIEQPKANVQVPDKIPYTTSASEFVYGTSAVEAALRCNKRQIYVLYIYHAADEELSPAKVSLRKIAVTNGVKVKMAYGRWSSLLDQMSEGRAHNGVVLEVSPLPKLPVTALRAVPSIAEEHFRVDLAPQTREEAAVNGLDNRIPIISQRQNRYPVVLLVDGIVDTGNFGAIIRSAYFLGIDAVVFAGRNSAPLSPAAMKASAGAAENMKILTVNNEVAFIKQSKANGWRFYAADAPGLGSKLIDRSSTAEEDSGLNPDLLEQAPSVLMMGSESSGLSSHIKSHADSIVSIPGARLDPHVGVSSDPARVDSLNVSVAAALLMEMFLRVPLALSAVPQKKIR